MLGKIGVLLIAAGIVCSAYGQETLSVVVTDGKGNRVRTLARADFQVVSRGSKNDIVAFTDATGAIPRRIAIVLDTTTISLPARVAIVDATRDFLAKSLRPVDRVLILTAGQSLTPLSEWTSDKGQIEAALQRASTATSQTMAGDRAQAERRVQELITNIQQTRGTFDNFDTLMNAVRNYAAAVYRDTRQSIGLLATVTDLFPSRANRNVLIIGGAGLPIRPGADMFQYLDTVKAQAEQGLLGSALRQGAARSSPMADANAFDLTQMLRDFAGEAWSRGIAIYTIDPEMSDSASTMVESQRTIDRAASFATTANRSAGYQLIADETGGLAFLARKPSDAIAEIASDLDTFYSIGIQPSAPIANRQSVQIQSKGYKIRFTPGGGQPTADAEISSRVIAHHLLKPDTNDLGITVQAATPVAEGEKRRVALKVMIPIKNLKFVQEGSEVTGGFSVYIATGDRLGHASSVTKQTKQLRWPAAALQAAGDKQLTFAVEVVLEPGRTQISVGVLDDRSKTTGYERVSI
ncbi:MAG TPA: VWA domain-containing protein [Thermoanaerobaculia bacterium]|nr:VWA domain-containing protein [Thermoanaerobaculia bacterium]